MNYNLSPQLPRYLAVILVAYSFFALVVAGIQIFIINTSQLLPFHPAVLLGGLGFYTVLKSWQPVRWYRSSRINLILIAVDTAVCAFLVLSTGGLESPFLLYTLSPVLRSALFLSYTVTSFIVLISGVYVVSSCIFNPLFFAPAAFSWSYFIIYITASCLAASLPYLINFNLRQRLLAEDILAERWRLSREIHDGLLQNLTVLRWNAELINVHLSRMGIEMEEARQFLALTEKSRQDALTSLKLLRCNKPDTDIVAHIQESLNALAPAIKTELNVKAREIRLESAVEHELLRICQEALTNIRKHSCAQHVRVDMQAVNSRLEVSITDDGSGFNTVSFYRDGFLTKGHGLAVMKERADLVGGKFRVLSSPGKGTEIRVEVPTISRLEGLWRK
jgi:signal transduction histidine kinase